MSATSRVPRVTVVQEYVPNYRQSLFDEMRRLAPLAGVDLVVAAGDARASQGARSDGSPQAVDLRVEQRELSMAGRRVVWRRLGSVYRNSDLVIVEQARRNLDVHLALRKANSKVAFWGHGRDFTHDVSSKESQLLDSMTLRAHWFFGYTPASVEHVVAAGFPESDDYLVQLNRHRCTPKVFGHCP